MASTAPRPPQPSRSKTGKVLSPAEHQQRINAAQSAARRRQREYDRAVAKSAKSARSARQATGPTKMTAGVGNSNAAGYVSTDAARSAFQAHGVSGADINQTRDPKSGFLTFSGKDPAVHRQFVAALRSQGFKIAIRPDGSGYAVNGAGQGIRLGRFSNRVAPQPRKIIKADPETGKISVENPVKRVSTRSLIFH